MGSLSRIAVSMPALALLAAAAPPVPDKPADAVLVYRLRGEIRPLLFWLGRDDVGTGRVALQRGGDPAADRWREEIEVLFASDPERTPRKVNRWGYGRESSEWLREDGSPTPRLLRTEFQGIMRHSEEASISDVAPDSKQAAAGYRYHATRSTVLPERAYSELRILSDGEEFQYRNWERLLSQYGERLAKMQPAARRQLENQPPMYGAPYGFLSGLLHLVRQIEQTHERQPDSLRRTRPSTVFVFNGKRNLLEVVNVKPLDTFETRYGQARFRDVAMIEFRSFNTVKRTRTDFTLWIPMTGEFKGLPVRILIQPRWWLRLRADLDLASCRFAQKP